MRTRSLRPALTIKRLLTVACLVAVVSALLSTSSSSAPGDPVPGQEDLPDRIISGGAGGVTLSQGTVVRRSKTYITIGGGKTPMFGVFYSPLYNTPIEDPTQFLSLCVRGRPCVADPFYQPACATDDITTQERGGFIRSLMYPVRLLARGVDVGFIARKRVNLAAFGSIPATATITLRAPEVNGHPEPFRILVWDVKQRGCEANIPLPEQRVHTLALGRAEITLSDLRVDGVPVDLGPRCRTVRPADLELWGADDYTPGGGGLLEAYDGRHQGTLAPLSSPYYGQDNGRMVRGSTGIEVPRFTGCGAKEDLSPLVTAMASGPDNPVRVVQSPIFPHEGGLNLNELDTICVDSPRACPIPGPDVPARPPLPAGDR